MPAVARKNGLRLDGIRVVLVEDEVDARESLTTALQLFGAQVVAVSSAAAALLALEHQPADVLLSDIGMPDQDGYALIRQVRAREMERGGRLPAAALTAYVRPEDGAGALSAGFDTHVHKPVEPLELAKLVQRLARRSS
jgi:CheY-like chemotaxis protein